jgi:HSP20 family protein
VLKEDLSVTISNTSLTIKGNAREEKEEAGEYLRREISRRGTFSRTISLPVEVDSTKGKAKFKDCLLELTLPKAAKLHTMKIE